MILYPTLVFPMVVTSSTRVFSIKSLYLLSVFWRNILSVLSRDDSPSCLSQGAIGGNSQGASFILRARPEVLNLEHPPRKTLGPRKRLSISQTPMKLSDGISQLGPLLYLRSVPSSTQSQKSHWWPSEGVEEEDKPTVGKATRG